MTGFADLFHNISKAAPHNGSRGLRRIFCPNRAVWKMGNTQSIPAFFILSLETKSLAESPCPIMRCCLKLWRKLCTEHSVYDPLRFDCFWHDLWSLSIFRSNAASNSMEIPRSVVRYFLGMTALSGFSTLDWHCQFPFSYSRQIFMDLDRNWNFPCCVWRPDSGLDRTGFLLPASPASGALLLFYAPAMGGSIHWIWIFRDFC